jgi:hypothetical protein
MLTLVRWRQASLTQRSCRLIPLSPPERPATEGDTNGGPRLIQLQADQALRFSEPAPAEHHELGITSGPQVADIALTPGETVLFQIENTSPRPHNFYIGQDAELSAPDAVTENGIPDWAPLLLASPRVASSRR